MAGWYVGIGIRPKEDNSAAIVRLGVLLAGLASAVYGAVGLFGPAAGFLVGGVLAFIAIVRK
jgi:hypothetical protein